MEQWMIFFRKIYYLSFIRTRTVCSFCILFVSSSFCSLEDTGGNCWHKKVPFFATLEPPKTSPPSSIAHWDYTAPIQQQHPHNNNNRRLQQYPHNSSTLTNIGAEE